MIDDLNKTPLTCKVTSDTALWLDARGFKPVETEVPMPMIAENQSGWIADIAGVIVPTQTELIELKLLPKRPPYRYRRPDNSSEFEFLMGVEHEGRAAWNEKRRGLERLMTCLVEVKTSRADFSGDRKWAIVPPTDLAYVAAPKGLLKPDEWPAEWGVLEWSEGSVRQLRAPGVRQSTIEHQLAITLAVAVRRDHHTRYARLREQKRAHGRESSDRIFTNMTRISKAVLRIAKGERESVEVNLALAGVNKPPEWLIEQLREIWAVLKVTEVRQGEEVGM